MVGRSVGRSEGRSVGRKVGRWEEEDSNLRRLRRRFYRPLPLAARASSRTPDDSERLSFRPWRSLASTSSPRWTSRRSATPSTRRPARSPSGSTSRTPGTAIALEGEAIEMHSATEDRLKAAYQVLQEKMVKRDDPLKALQPADGRAGREGHGPPDREARDGYLRREGQGDLEVRPRQAVPKAQTQIQGAQVRVTGKSRTTCRPRSRRSRSTTSASPCSSRTTADLGIDPRTRLRGDPAHRYPCRDLRR